MKKILRVWLKWAYLSFLSVFGANRLSALLFLLGKFVRFFFFLIVLLLFVGKAKVLAGYTLDQVIFFFLVFNLVDISAQFLFRGVYWLRSKLISGRFDYTLLRPVNPLFNVLFSHPDPLDLITLFFLIGFMVVFVLKRGLVANLSSVFLFFLLLVNAFILALALHIIVCAFGIITLEVDNAIWILRDLSRMGRVPVDIYAPPLRRILTFLTPVAIMITFPAKALMGILSWQGVVFSFVISSLFLGGAFWFWRFALTRYTSASS